MHASLNAIIRITYLCLNNSSDTKSRGSSLYFGTSLTSQLFLILSQNLSSCNLNPFILGFLLGKTHNKLYSFSKWKYFQDINSDSPSIIMFTYIVSIYYFLGQSHSSPNCSMLLGCKSFIIHLVQMLFLFFYRTRNSGWAPTAYILIFGQFEEPGKSIWIPSEKKREAQFKTAYGFDLNFYINKGMV